jgi:hypothetical protein
LELPNESNRLQDSNIWWQPVTSKIMCPWWQYSLEANPIKLFGGKFTQVFVRQGV